MHLSFQRDDPCCDPGRPSRHRTRLITIVFNISPLYLPLASVLIPVPSGFVAFVVSRLGLRGAFAIGISTATIAVAIMLVITGVNDVVPIIPHSCGEWREVAEYVASVCLAFVTGNILSALIFKILPGTLAGGGRPNPVAFKVARLLGQHAGEEQLRRRARLIRDLMRTPPGLWPALPRQTPDRSMRD